MLNREVVFALDIGTTKIVALAGRIDSEGDVEVLGRGESFSIGIRKGNVVDIENIAGAIRRALNELYRTTGLNSAYTYVGYSGAGVEVTRSFAYTMVTNPRREVTNSELSKVLKECRLVKLPAGRRVLHIITGDFTIDGCRGIIDPVGMTGSRLQVETTIVSAPSVNVQNLIRPVELAGCRATRVVLNIIGSSVVLSQEEKEMGVALVDIGAGVTTIAVFAQGRLCYVKALPIGGDHVTSDLAIGLRTTITAAEELKLKYGSTGVLATPDNELVEINGVGSTTKRKVTKQVISSIIDPRLQEILDLIKNVIVESGHDSLIPCGYVLVGGGVLLPGMPDLAQRELNAQVRLGTMEQGKDFNGMSSDSTYIPTLGLLDYGLRNHFLREKKEKRDIRGNLVYRVKNWFQDVLNSG